MDRSISILGQSLLKQYVETNSQFYNGTLIGSATLVPGLTGNAVKLNGINSYVQIKATNILQNVNDFTVATWVYLNSLVNGTEIFDFGFGTAQYVMFTSCGNGCVAQFSFVFPMARRTLYLPHLTTYRAMGPYCSNFCRKCGYYLCKRDRFCIGYFPDYTGTDL